jgi:hypothetical protein
MQTDVDSKRLAALAEAVKADKLRLPIAKRFSLAEAASAPRLAEAGGISKFLLKFDYPQCSARGNHATHQVTIQDSAKPKHQDRDRSGQAT